MDIKVNNKTDFYLKVNNFAKIEKNESLFIKKASNYENAFISVVIPTYKRIDTLQETINSVLSQVFFLDYTILVIDNNPERNDITETFMNSIENNKISYVKNSSNLGMAGNWNRGISIAKSKWVCLLHDDDVLCSDFFSKTIPFLEKNPNLCILQSKKFRGSGVEDRPLSGYDGNVYRVVDIDFYRSHIIDVPSGIIYNRDTILEEGGFNPDYYPSIDMSFHMFLASRHQVFILNTPLMWYRTGMQNASKAVQSHIGWIIVDFYLIRQMLMRHHLPNWIIMPYLEFKAERSAELNQSEWKSDFELPKDYLIWNGYSKFRKMFSCYFLKVYIKLYHIYLVHKL